MVEYQQSPNVDQPRLYVTSSYWLCVVKGGHVSCAHPLQILAKFASPASRSVGSSAIVSPIQSVLARRPRHRHQGSMNSRSGQGTVGLGGD